MYTPKNIKSKQNVLIKTTDVNDYKDKNNKTILCTSAKLQEAGYPVVAISGGIIGDKKVHYFKLSLEQAKSIEDENGNKLLNAINFKFIEEVNTVTPSKVIDTGLKEKLFNTVGIKKEEEK